jgi:hypothetical protein
VQTVLGDAQDPSQERPAQTVAGDAQDPSQGNPAQTVADCKRKKLVDSLAEKIRKGLTEKGKRENKREKAQLRDKAALKKQTASTEITLSTGNHFIPTVVSKDYFIPTDESMDILINHLLQMADGLIVDGKEDAWRLRYLASCLHIFGGKPDNSIKHNATLVRSVNAARLINLIVNGVWGYWGPSSAFVWDAIASKVNSLLQL